MIEVYNTGQASGLVTVRKLRQALVQHGLPDAVVSDNGPRFASSMFLEFTRQNGIQHIKVALYHPAPMVWQNVPSRHSKLERRK